MKTDRDILKSILQIVVVLASVLVVLFLFIFLPVTYKDWVVSFRPSALAWRNPYHGLTFNPPWLFLILHPIATLPPRVGAGILMFISFVIIALYVRSPLKIFFVALSAPMIVLLTLGNIDGLVILGLMFPYWMSLPFLMIKPQGVFLAAVKRLSFWSICFVIFFLLFSVFVWGLWWQDISNLSTPVSAEYNLSAFPYSVVPGLLLLVLGLRKNSDALLCFASLCFSPYFMITSLLPAVAASLRETRDKKIWFVIVIGSWIYYFMMK